MVMIVNTFVITGLIVTSEGMIYSIFLGRGIICQMNSMKQATLLVDENSRNRT
jgi:ABC-type lipoprotein release transport system permease subunit